MKARGIVGLIIGQLVTEALGAAWRWVTGREQAIPLKPKPPSAAGVAALAPAKSGPPALKKR